MKLKCPGVGRDKDCANALQFYFDRPVTDDEMQFLHEVMERALASVPAASIKLVAGIQNEGEEK